MAPPHGNRPVPNNFQFDDDIYDDVNELKKEEDQNRIVESLKETPITDDYINDEPIKNFNETVQKKSRSFENETDNIDKNHLNLYDKEMYEKISLQLLKLLKMLF